MKAASKSSLPPFWVYPGGTLSIRHFGWHATSKGLAIEAGLRNPAWVGFQAMAGLRCTIRGDGDSPALVPGGSG